MTDEDRQLLVMRLRNDAYVVATHISFTGTTQQRFTHRLSEQAADCIEADGKQIAVLKRRVEQLKSMFDTVSKQLEKARAELRDTK